jgi:hypothetical protein
MWHIVEKYGLNQTWTYIYIYIYIYSQHLYSTLVSNYILTCYFKRTYSYLNLIVAHVLIIMYHSFKVGFDSNNEQWCSWNRSPNVYHEVIK